MGSLNRIIEEHMHISTTDHKGRGAQHNPHNRFKRFEYEPDDAYLEYCRLEEETDPAKRTRYIEVFPKTVLSKNDSPDVPFNYSINPYQGCEHGCTYCYARNSHEFWGYSAGLDFERVILVKKEAPKILETRFRSGKWKPQMIAFSGNTDCYQPAERRFGITRQMLELFWEYRHPVGIITKNSLILRDLDLLKKLNEKNLLRVSLSITTLNEDVRRVMEPRTATVKQRLKALEVLTDAGIPVSVNFAPIIPGINSHEVMDLVREVGARGASRVGYIMLRLNGQIGEIFSRWVKQAFPERAEKILNLVSEAHGGQLNDSRYGKRMSGEGKYADQIKELFRVANARYIVPQDIPDLDYSLFSHHQNPQLSLF